MATFSSSTSQIVLNIKTFQSLVAAPQRDSDSMTECARQLLMNVRSMRQLLSAMNEVPSIANSSLPPKTVPAFRQVGVSISALVQIGRDNTSNSPEVVIKVRQATSSIVAAIRHFLEIIPKPMQALTVQQFHNLPRNVPRSQNQPKKPSPREISPRLNENSPKPSFEQNMSRLSTMLDNEIAAVTEEVKQKLAVKNDNSIESKKNVQNQKTNQNNNDNNNNNSNNNNNDNNDNNNSIFSKLETDPSSQPIRKQSNATQQQKPLKSTLIANSINMIDKIEDSLKQNNTLNKANATLRSMTMPTSTGSRYNEQSFNQFKNDHSVIVELVENEFARQTNEIEILKSMVLDQGLEGWMEKQGGGHMSKAWKERFFILRNGVLSYYTSEDVEKPSGFLYVTDATVARNSMKDRQHTFEIRTPKRTYFIAAESKQQCDTWVNKINELVQKARELKQNASTSSSKTITIEDLWRQRQIEETKAALQQRAII